MPDDVVPASRKLGRDDAVVLAAKVSSVIAAKGKKVETFNVAAGASDEAIAAMLGPTGNLRSPTILAGKTLLVGFNEEQFTATLLG